MTQYSLEVWKISDLSGTVQLLSLLTQETQGFSWKVNTVFNEEKQFRNQSSYNIIIDFPKVVLGYSPTRQRQRQRVKWFPKWFLSHFFLVFILGKALLRMSATTLSVFFSPSNGPFVLPLTRQPTQYYNYHQTSRLHDATSLICMFSHWSSPAATGSA